MLLQWKHLTLMCQRNKARIVNLPSSNGQISGNVCKSVPIWLDNASFAYVNFIFQKTFEKENNRLIPSNELGEFHGDIP